VIFFASDVHGSERCFQKFLNAGKAYQADVLILSGDITGKMIVPLVRQSDGSFEASVLGEAVVARTEKELETLEERIRERGYYPYRTSDEEKQELDCSEKKVYDLFSRLMLERVQRWVRMAEDRLGDSKIKCFMSPGNDDRFAIDPVLSSSEIIVNPENIVVELDEYHEMITLGYTNTTPWKTARECTEEELAIKIKALTSEVRDMKNCVFNLHCPPYDTVLDSAPVLDEKLKPVATMGAIMMGPAGSTAVRDSIERNQPLLGLHGHIHESKGAVKLGRTLCLNAGSEYEQGVLKGVLVKLEKNCVRGHLFVSG
jgi:Icc-related predicted phosphoesterase